MSQREEQRDRNIEKKSMKIRKKRGKEEREKTEVEGG